MISRIPRRLGRAFLIGAAALTAALPATAPAHADGLPDPGFTIVAGATALDTLDALKIGADDTVVISAAAGGVGSIEAQLAKHRGSTVVGTCGERNFDYLRQLGIKPVRYGEGITDRIRRAARWPGDRLDRQLRTGSQRPRGGAGRARRPLQVER